MCSTGGWYPCTSDVGIDRPQVVVAATDLLEIITLKTQSGEISQTQPCAHLANIIFPTFKDSSSVFPIPVAIIQFIASLYSG